MGGFQFQADEGLDFTCGRKQYLQKRLSAGFSLPCPPLQSSLWDCHPPVVVTPLHTRSPAPSPSQLSLQTLAFTPSFSASFPAHPPARSHHKPGRKRKTYEKRMAARALKRRAEPFGSPAEERCPAGSAAGPSPSAADRELEGPRNGDRQRPFLHKAARTAHNLRPGPPTTCL